MRKTMPYLASVLLLAWFATFMGLPLYTVLVVGLRWEYITEIARTDILREGLLNSFRIGLCTTALVFLLAVPLALLYDRYDFRGKTLVTTAMFLPMILPPFVGALGVVKILGQLGALNALLTWLGIVAPKHGPDWLGGGGRFWAVCLLESLHLFPILYLNTVTALANVDPALDEAARNLGASRWRRFFTITLPLIRPGLFAGGSIVFIWSFTELGTPLMLNYPRVTTVQVFDGLKQLETNPQPYALVVVLLVVSGGLYALSRWLFGQDTTAVTVKGVAGSAARPLRGWRQALPLAAFAGAVGLAILPHLGMTLLSFAEHWYNSVLPTRLTLTHHYEALTNQYVLPSVWNSVFYAGLATVAALVVGVLIALLTVRWKPVGWQLFDVLAMLPLAIPGLVLAFGYLSMGTRYEWLRRIADPVANPTILLVIAYAMRRLPYVTRAVVAGLQQTPVELELAARNLGAGPWLTLRRITVPLITANLVVGALFAFSFSMLEVSDSLILAQTDKYYPITRAIYQLTEILGAGPAVACAFGVWAMLFLGVTLYLGSVLMGRKMGALFRF